MHPITRRGFLQDSAALAAAVAGAGTVGPLRAAEKAAKKADANDQLHVACIGVRGQGMTHVTSMAAKHNCVITTICDADEASIGKAMTHVEKVQGKAPKYEQDLRKVLDDKSIDVITTATPNHWHALIAIWAMQAGKDVYVEKPCSHNVSEGRRIVEAARKYNRICQIGTQSRSNGGLRDAIQYLRDGKLGQIKVARGICYKDRPSIGKVKGPQPIPKTVDYNLWCGPAPMKPLMRQKLHYDWHWFWDYGNGDLGNQGIHEMDKARWGLGKEGLPKAVISVGGRFGYVDDGETANTQICVFDYGDAELIFEVRGLASKSPFDKPHKGNWVGNVYHCEKGMVVLPSYSGGAAYSNDGQEIQKFNGTGDHYANFVKAVRSRKPDDLNAEILEGHLSSALCHLGNISYRLGTLQPFNQKTKALGDDKVAVETLARMEEHLKENMVPIEETSYHLGRKLAIDPKTETFVGDTEANALLTREYRSPFVVPAKV